MGKYQFSEEHWHFHPKVYYDNETIRVKIGQFSQFSYPLISHPVMVTFTHEYKRADIRPD